MTEHRARARASEPDSAARLAGPEPARAGPHAMLLSLQRTAGKDAFMEHKPTGAKQPLNFPAGLREGPGRQIPA